MPFNSAQGDERYESNPVQQNLLRGQGLYPAYAPPEGYTPFPKPEMQYKPLQNPVKKYINSGNREEIPQYNSTEMMIINGGIEKELIEYYRTNPEFAKEVLEGGGVKKFFRNLKKGANKAFTKIGDEIKKSAIDKDGFIHQAISNTADYAIPALGAAASTYFTGNPEIGEAVGKSARNTLKEKTGYGVKSGGGGVGIYKGGNKSSSSTQKMVQSEINKAINQFLPEGTTVMGKGVADVANKPAPKALKNNKSREDRNIIVKRIMAERGIKSMPEASSIVKAEGLYKPKSL